MGYLDATMETETLRGVTGKGITLYTNDPVYPRRTLSLKALVMGSVLVLPDEDLALSNTNNGRRVLRRVLRKDPTESGTLVVGDLQSTAPWLSVEVRPVEAGAPKQEGLPVTRVGDYLLEVRLDGQTDYGRLVGQVEFTTGLERQPVVRLPVELDLRPPVSLQDDRLVLTNPRVPAEVVLSVRRGLDPAGLRVESHPPGLAVELEPAGGRFYKAHVSWQGGALRDGRVTFEVGGERVALAVETP